MSMTKTVHCWRTYQCQFENQYSNKMVPKDRDREFDDSEHESQPLAVSSPQRNKRKNSDNNSDNSILITNRDQFQLVIQQDDNWLMSGVQAFYI